MLTAWVCCFTFGFVRQSRLIYGRNFLLHRVVADSRSVEQFDVFVSYKWYNKETVKKIVQRLKDNDYETWFDEDYMGLYMLQAYSETRHYA